MTSPLWLRVIQINDVYELDNLANLKTLVDEKKRNGPDETLVLLAGDFLAPSLLSSLDKGSGMVDCMNAVGVTHVCIGNHETDVAMTEIPKRIDQSNFVWVNTNMQEINAKLNIRTPEYEIIKVSNGSMQKKICLLGLLTDDPGLYRPDSFAGVKIEPVISTAEDYVKKLTDEVDFFLPMTHQSIADDRIFAKHFGGKTFPIVIGGHDHEPFDETYQGSRIIKAGCDAENAAVIDLKWQDTTSDGVLPTVSVDLLPTSSFAPDPAIAARIASHELLLTELEKARLFLIQNLMAHCMTMFPSAAEFSTVENRLRPSLGTTALATTLRAGLQCECAIINGGNVRGNKIYDKTDFFTYGDLKAEIPFPCKMAVVHVPGSVLEDTITHSRTGSREKPPVAKGGYLHTCNNIHYNDQRQCIESIGDEAFEPDRLYLTAIPHQFFEGIDNHEPLLKWAAVTGFTSDEDAATEAKLAIAKLFSAVMWLHLGSFHEMDTDGDGVLTREEVKAGAKKVYGEDLADVIVDNVMSVADTDGDGTISPMEMMVVHFVATDMIHHVGTNEEMTVLKQTAALVLDKDIDDEHVSNMVESILNGADADTADKTVRNENVRVLGKLRRTSMLS